MGRVKILLAAVLLAWSVTGAAYATTLSFETTVDLAIAQYFFNPDSPTGVVNIYPMTDPLSIHTGDSVDMTVRFLNGQSLSMQSNGGIQFLSGWIAASTSLSPLNSSNFTITNATLDFIGAYGEVVSSFFLTSQSSGSAHIGPLFMDSYLPKDEVLTFNGYRTTFDVSALQGDQCYYDGVLLEFANLDGGSIWFSSPPQSPNHQPCYSSAVALQV